MGYFFNFTDQTAIYEFCKLCSNVIDVLLPAATFGPLDRQASHYQSDSTRYSRSRALPLADI